MFSSRWQGQLTTKGTALFRGNDLLQRSAAKMLTMTTGAHKHCNMRDMALTGTGKAARLQCMPTCQPKEACCREASLCWPTQ